MARTVDWSTLLSVVAQSAAALVAIIGGFLVSRLIQLSVDQNALHRRIENIRSDVAQTQDELDVTGRRLLLYHTAKLLSLILRRTPNTSSLQDVAGVTFIADYYRRTNSMLEQELGWQFDKMIQRIVQTLHQANVTIGEARDAGDLPATYEEYRSSFNKELDLLEDRVFAAVFDSVREYGNLLGTRWEDIQKYLLSGSPPELAIQSDESYQKLAEESRRLLRLLHLQQQQLSQARADVVRTAGLPELWGAIVVLVYLSFAGIVVPLLYLGHQPPLDLADVAVDIRAGSLSHLTIILSIFILGLILLLAYIILLMLRFRKGGMPGQNIVDDHNRALAGVSLPRRTAEFPRASHGQIQNAMLGYVQERADAPIQIGSDHTGNQTVSFIYHGRRQIFNGDTEFDALREAYLALYNAELLERKQPHREAPVEPPE